MILSVSDFSYRKFCYYGNYKNDPGHFLYEVDDVSADFRERHFFYFIFYGFLKKIFNEIQKGKEIRIDNFEDSFFSKVKEFIPYEIISSPKLLFKFEKISRELSLRIVSIVEDLNGGVIISNGNKVNVPIKSLGTVSYLRFTVDFAYFNANEELRVLSFQPFKDQSLLNIKTALTFSFLDELFDVKDIKVFTLGSDVKTLVDLDYIVPLKETPIVTDKSKSFLLTKLSNAVKDTILTKNVSYDLCSSCVTRKKCEKKI